MLSAPDAKLVQHDRSLPGLALLLDPDAMVEQLRRLLPDAGIRAATARYLRYKPFTNCLAGYRLSAASGEFDIYAKAHRPDAIEKLEKARSRHRVPDGLGLGRIVLNSVSVVAAAFPNDDKLQILRRWSDTGRRHKLLKRLVHRSPLAQGELEVLGYKPERRIVARIVGPDGCRGVLRGCLAGAFAQSTAGARAFQSRGALRIARCLGTSGRDHALALEWLPGRPLADVLVDDDAFQSSTLVSIGAALAELHGQQVECLPVQTLAQESCRLGAVARAMAFVCPHIARRVLDLPSRILARLPLSRVQSIHGDFYAKQVLLSGDAVAFIDFDEAAIGDPTTDLATFLAHLERNVLAGRLSRGRLELSADLLLDGYRRVTSMLPLQGLEARLAGSLLCLAPHPFRDREPDWRDRIEAILARAYAVLDRSPASSSSIRAPNGELFSDRDRDAPQVSDPFGVTDDQALPFAASALDPVVVEQHFARLPRLADLGHRADIASIRVIRYKPGRRCLIEYGVRAPFLGPGREIFKILGKMRHGAVDRRTCRLVELLRDHGFDDKSPDGVSVPDPIGVVSQLQMWVQTYVEGAAATALLAERDGGRLAARIGEAIHKLHAVRIPMLRSHTLADELKILGQRLAEVESAQPADASRLARLLEACEALASSVHPMPQVPIHRDFYPDQVLVDGERLWLVDFDLCCRGDAALDAGNFLGHLIEEGLRTWGHADALAGPFNAFRGRFLELTGLEHARAVDIYTTLTLARHIWISTQLPARRAFTGRLLELCEARLGLTACVARSARV